MEGFNKPNTEVKKAGFRIPEKIKEAFRRGLLSLLLTYGSTGEALGENELNRFQEEEIVSTEVVGVCEFKEESSVIGEDIVKNYLFTDTKERIFLSEGDNDSYIEPNNVVNNKDNSVFSLGDAVNFCKEKGINNVTITHTHPLSVYSGVFYSDEDLKEVRLGNMKPSPMSPSTTDLQTVTKEIYFLQKEGISIENKVFDPTGVWKYKVGKEDIDKFNRFKQMVDEIYAINSKITESISEKELEVIKKNKINGVHPEKFFQFLSQNSETRLIGEKLQKIAQRESEKLFKKYPELIQAQENIDNISHAIYNYYRFENTPFQPKQELSQLIEKNIIETKKLGLTLEYIPYQNVAKNRDF